MARFIKAWTHVCLTYRKTVLAVLAAVTAVAASGLPRAAFDNALEIWFLDDDPALLSHQRLLRTFGSDELIMVGLEAPDVFAPAVLERIHRLTERIEAAPHVEKVFSLTNIESITGHNATLEVGDLIPFPLEPASLPSVRERALANDLYVGNVVSAGGDFAAIIARLPHRADDFDYKIEAVAAIRQILADEPDTVFFLGGGPVVDEQFFHLSEADGRFTTMLMAGILVVMLWLLLRSFWGIAIPFATVSLATVWAMGWIVLAGVKITVITTMLPPLMLAVGVADAMHVLVDYQNHSARGQDKVAALRDTYRELFLPCLLTTVTTCVGLLSLLVSRVQGIREFGIFAALGVAGAFLLSVTFVPIALSYLPQPSGRAVRTNGLGLSARGLGALHGLTMRYGTRIVAACVCITALGLAGASRVRSESAFLEYFKDSQQVKQDTRRLEGALGGTYTMEVMVDTGRTDGVKDPEVLGLVAELQTFLEAQPEISATQSVADYFKDLRRAFFDNDQREYRLPESAEEAAQYLLLYELAEPDGDILEYVTYDYREGRVSARVTMESSAYAADLVRRTRQYIATHFPGGTTGTVTGVALLYANMEDYIRLSLVKGFSVALVAIFLVLSLQLRSLALGAIAMIPNLLPIVVCLGIMGFSGILLDSMTALVASITIGLAVDDTVHFLGRMRLHLDAGRSVPEALRFATVEMGRALVFTSVTLCAGFGVLMFGSFVGTVHFGLLATLTIFVALAADLVLLPVVLRWYAAQGAPRLAAAVVDAPPLGRS